MDIRNDTTEAVNPEPVEPYQRDISGDFSTVELPTDQKIMEARLRGLLPSAKTIGEMLNLTCNIVTTAIIRGNGNIPVQVVLLRAEDGQGVFEERVDLSTIPTPTSRVRRLADLLTKTENSIAAGARVNVLFYSPTTGDWRELETVSVWV